MPIRTLTDIKVCQRHGRFNIEGFDGRMIHELHTFDGWRASLCSRAGSRAVKFETMDTRYGERIVNCYLLDEQATA